MDTFLNAGFGEPLSISDLELVRYLGFAGIRQDVPTPAVAQSLVDNVLESGLAGIFVVPVRDAAVCQGVAHVVAGRAAQLGEAERVVIEVGNEEDLKGKRWGRDPHGWALLVKDVLTIAGQHGFAGQVVSGGVSSVSHDALDWLKASRVAELECGIGYHQYRSTAPFHPLDGYPSRAEEFDALAAVAAGREIWCTESGWTTAPSNTREADLQVTANLKQEIALNAAHGARSFCVYQLNDGPDPDNGQDRFGIRRGDGSLKPQAGVLV